MPRVGAPVRRWPAEVRHTVVAVNVPGVADGLEQRSGCAAGDQHIRAAGDIKHLQCVADDVVHAGVATDTGDRTKLHVRVQSGQQQGTSVIHAGVDIENERHGPGQVCTNVTGIDESAGRSRAEGRRPLATIAAPSAATIAPLSVHKPGRGTRRRIPAVSQRSWAMARKRVLAATPPPTSRSSTPCSRQARTALRVNTSTTASWKLAATSATGARSPASTQRATEVLRPENEKSKR